jgi:D-3-phosphoglycerate dehydrogenase
MFQKNIVLIIDEMHPSIIPLLEKEGFEVDYRPKIKRDEIMGIIATYSGLIIRSKTTMDKELSQILSLLPKLHRYNLK